VKGGLDYNIKNIKINLDGTTTKSKAAQESGCHSGA
jgi:hypothetical protein